MIQCLLIVALPSEARPLVERYRLRAATSLPYRLYSKDCIALVETGLGKLNAAAATSAALCSLMNTQSFAPVCLNVGLAGSDNDIGTMFCAHRVTDADSGQKWYPQQIWQAPCAGIEVCTVSQPETSYLPTQAFDMEASGILSCATRHTTLEFIHCLKIISDNPHNSHTRIDKAMASELVASNSETIAQSVEQLIALRETLPDNSKLESLLDNVAAHYKPSSTHKVQLYNLLQRYQTLDTKLPLLDDLLSHSDTRSLLRSLQVLLDNYKRTY